MNALPEGVTISDLERYARLAEGIKKLTSEKEELGGKIKNAFSDHYKDAGKSVELFPTMIDTTIIVTLNTQHRLRKTTQVELAERFPHANHPTYYVLAINTDAIPAAILDEYREPTRTLSIDVASNRES